MDVRMVRWLLLVGVLIVTSSAMGGTYELSWDTIGGGGVSSGGTYSLTGIVGRPEAGAMSGGNYELLGGFLPGGPFCIVDFYSFAIFAEYWLETGCNAGNNWCGGADLDGLGDVDFVDAGQFADEWLELCPTNWSLK